MPKSPLQLKKRSSFRGSSTNLHKQLSNSKTVGFQENGLETDRSCGSHFPGGKNTIEKQSSISYGEQDGQSNPKLKKKNSGPSASFNSPIKPIPTMT
jgi:hypothetical protein